MPDPNALLTGMRITFYTTDDNKDDNTRLEIWINKAGEKEAAYLDAAAGTIEDPSTRVFDVPPKNNQMRRAEIPGSWVQVRIAPDGNDRWTFACDVMLRFSDNTVHEQSFGKTTLDENSTDVRHYLVA